MIGKRVKINECESVCSYLFHHTGEIISERDDIFKPMEKIYVIKLDIPATHINGWPSLETIGLNKNSFHFLP